MALKDWEKEYNGKHKVHFKRKTGAVIDLNEGQYKQNVFWTFDASYDDGFGRKEFETFSTKSQAIAFAKEYMRTH